MNGESITIASGIILLIVFVFVGWNLRRKRAREGEDPSKVSLEQDRK